MAVHMTGTSLRKLLDTDASARCSLWSLHGTSTVAAHGLDL